MYSSIALSRNRYSYYPEEEVEEESTFLNSPTNWICQSLQYLSPTEKNRTFTTYTTTSTDTSRYDDDPLGNGTTSTAPPRKVHQEKDSKQLRMPSSIYDPSSPSSSKIIAPNVAKLSPSSTVEIMLQSSIEDAVILCSADVLKMRSKYFQSLLLEQEKTTFTASPPTGDVMWRAPIVLDEPSPYEGAAFLESLHEGKGLYSKEWNLCWARLRSSFPLLS
jgi:hypothetical protein